MIFLTVGSEIAFDRLVQAVDIWCEKNPKSNVFGQIADPGSKGYRPHNFPWKEFISPDEYSHKYNKAELIIGHAGMGSIISALVNATPILIMPRRVSFRETRNDHQVDTAKRFSQHKGIYVAEDESMISPMLDKWQTSHRNLTMESIGPYADKQLITTIREFILNSDDL